MIRKIVKGSKKIIFLDIDDVLLTQMSYIAHVQLQWFNGMNYKLMDREKTLAIARLCLTTDSNIVLSSTHRKFKGAFDSIKIQTGLPLIDSTPILGYRNRGEEIKSWMRNNRELVNAYCIIDDDSDMLEEQLNNFVQVDGRHGFNCDNYDQAQKILGLVEDEEELRFRERQYLKYRDWFLKIKWDKKDD